MSRRGMRSGDILGLLTLFAQLQETAFRQTSANYKIVVIQEAGLDGFWIHRLLVDKGFESLVVDPASIAMPRRARHVKTDRIDGETLVRTLLAHKRGEPRVCAIVKPPTPEEEDRRRICRERKTLTTERIMHVNRIQGLLFAQGISGYRPLNLDRRQRLEELSTGDGRPLSANLKAQISRELDRLELLLKQIAAVEAEREGVLAAARLEGNEPPAMLEQLRGIGPEFAAVIWSEGLYRHFDNRRQVAAYAGLASTPWQSGSIDYDQGMSKAGNPRLRSTMIQLAWLWLRHQPNSSLSRWFHQRSKDSGGAHRKRMVVALARKLLVALWKFVSAGVVIEGAITKNA